MASNERIPVSLHDMAEPEVQAAGGVIVKNGEVAVVHRPHYDDWSLPKGKLEPGETFETAALREIEEETGLTCKLGRELAPVHYFDHRGRLKIVRYWIMEVVSGEFKANEEVDELCWVEPSSVAEYLTYETDVAVIADAAL